MAEKSRGEHEYILVLNDIRSVYNVGALFRTADAVGITRIIMAGFSPTPIDRFGRARTDLAKSALGAELSIPWEYVDDLAAKVVEYRDKGFHIVGIEQDARAIDYKKIKKTEKVLFILGTETTGMEESLLGLCDTIVEIPMQGTKESLNVSVAAGIVLYRTLDQ